MVPKKSVMRIAVATRFVEDLQEARELDVVDVLGLLLGVLVHPVGGLGGEIDAEHLLVGDGQAGTVSELLGGTDAEVGADGPV